MLNKEKYVFFDENGIPLDQKTTVDEHVQECTECSDAYLLFVTGATGGARVNFFWQV